MTDQDEFDQGMPWANQAEASTEQPSADTETEAASEEQPAGEQESEKDPLASTLEKYDDDPDKMAKALAESQSYIGDLHRTQGELQSELARLRELQEQQFAWQRQRAEEEYQPDYDDLLDEDPRQAVDWAVRRGDQPAIDRAWKAWHDTGDSDAVLWREQYNMARVQQMMATQAMPVQEERFARQLAGFQRDHPDLAEYQDAMGQVIDEMPFLKVVLENPASEPDAKFHAVKHAYEVAKARSAATLHGATQDVARAQALAAEEAQREAFVASGSNAVRENPSQQSAADILAADWGNSGIHWGE